jgi:hypothetical protein
MGVILHIGIAKTGTTHIQKNLLTFEQRLEELGIHLVPDVGTPNNFKAPLLGYLDSDQADDLTTYWGIDSQESLEKAQEQIVKSIGSVASAGGAALMSSEHFHSRLTSREHVLAFRNRLEGSDLAVEKIIMYIREPFELARSLHSTAIRCGATTIEVPPATAPHYANLCNHYLSIKRWRDAFRESDLIVRRYLGGPDFDVWRDFIQGGLGIVTLDDSFRNPDTQRSNKSLSENSLVMMCAVNRSMKRAIGNGWTSHRALQFSRRLSDLPVDESMQPSAELRALLQKSITELGLTSEVAIRVADELGKSIAAGDLDSMTSRYRRSIDHASVTYATTFSGSDEAVRRECFAELQQLW